MAIACLSCATHAATTRAEDTEEVLVWDHWANQSANGDKLIQPVREKYARSKQQEVLSESKGNVAKVDELVEEKREKDSLPRIQHEDTIAPDSAEDAFDTNNNDNDAPNVSGPESRDISPEERIRIDTEDKDTDFVTDEAIPPRADVSGSDDDGNLVATGHHTISSESSHSNAETEDEGEIRGEISIDEDMAEPVTDDLVEERASTENDADTNEVSHAESSNSANENASDALIAGGKERASRNTPGDLSFNAENDLEIESSSGSTETEGNVGLGLEPLHHKGDSIAIEDKIDPDIQDASTIKSTVEESEMAYTGGQTSNRTPAVEKVDNLPETSASGSEESELKRDSLPISDGTPEAGLRPETGGAEVDNEESETEINSDPSPLEKEAEDIIPTVDNDNSNKPSAVSDDNNQSTDGHDVDSRVTAGKAALSGGIDIALDTSDEDDKAEDGMAEDGKGEDGKAQDLIPEEGLAPIDDVSIQNEDRVSMGEEIGQAISVDGGNPSDTVYAEEGIIKRKPDIQSTADKVESESLHPENITHSAEPSSTSTLSASIDEGSLPNDSNVKRESKAEDQKDLSDSADEDMPLANETVIDEGTIKAPLYIYEDDDVIDFDPEPNSASASSASVDQDHLRNDPNLKRESKPEDQKDPSDSTCEDIPLANETIISEEATIKAPVDIYEDDDIIDFDAIDRKIGTKSKEDSGTASDSKESADATVVANKSVDMEDPVVTHDEQDIPESKTHVSSTDKADSEHATEEDSKKESGPKKGSLADFFNKVSKGDDKLGKTGSSQAGRMKVAKVESVAQDDPVHQRVVEKSIPDPIVKNEQPGRHDATSDVAPEQTGGWGVRKHEAATKSVFPDGSIPRVTYSRTDPIADTAGEIPLIYRAADTDFVTGSASKAEEETKDSTGDSELPARVQQKSANSEFVDGLDDIDKFLENVDPPDELDVGAAGSSIQEVFFGQSTQILIKRVKLGGQIVRRKFTQVRVEFDQFIARRRDEDGEFALITREEVEAVAQKFKRFSIRALRGAQDLLDDLFVDDVLDDDLLDLDIGLDKVQAKLGSLREKLAINRYGNDAALKKGFDADVDAFIRQRLS